MKVLTALTLAAGEHFSIFSFARFSIIIKKNPVFKNFQTFRSEEKLYESEKMLDLRRG